jgi:vacuolar protein-sorting-associated protein 4
MSWADIESERLLEPPLLLKDFSRAIHNSRPTVSQDDLKKNEEWTTEFGFEGA